MNAEEFFKLFNVTEKDLENIREFSAAMDGKVDQLVLSLTDYLRASLGEEFSLHFPDDAVLNRAQNSSRRSWLEFLEATWDESYVKKRIRIAEVHAQIQVEPRHYMGTMYQGLELLLKLSEGAFPAEQMREYEESLRKVVAMESAFVVDIYSRRTNEIIIQQSRALTDMSTPITALWEGILMLPVVGIVDSRRAHDIMERMLEEIAKKRAVVFILDISGVAVVDTAVANHFIRMTKAAKLMGSYPIVSGLSPSVAQTIVELGIEVGEMHTTGNLQDALKIAFDRIAADKALARPQ